MKRNLLFFVDYYLPGYKAGGPVTSIANLVDFLGEEANINIVTRNHDQGDNIPYRNLKSQKSVSIGKATVKYLSKKHYSFRHFLTTIHRCNPSIIYLNSAFSWHFSIKILLLKKLGLLSDVQLVMAPRGELSLAALKLKRVKKKIFLAVAKLFNLYNNVKFQAASLQEAGDIQKVFGSKVPIFIAKDLSRLPTYQTFTAEKRNGLKIVFFSRISPMKNLSYVIDCLSYFQSENDLISLDVYGPKEDKTYWNKCISVAKHLPDNIKINYFGELHPSEVHKTLKQYDLFFLPTLGENYGHVIYEALAAGCPILISDQTPWRDLEKLNVGWDVNLTHKKYFIEIINKLIPMEEKDFSKYRQSCLVYAKKIASDTKNLEANRRLFLQE